MLFAQTWHLSVSACRLNSAHFRRSNSVILPNRKAMHPIFLLCLLILPRQSTSMSIASDSSCPTAFGSYPTTLLGGTGANTPRCSHYVECVNRIPYLRPCPASLVFDTDTSRCVRPGETTRQECHTKQISGFSCPEVRVLRFGTYDIASHPTDCSKFYVCLADGTPRVAGCQEPKVFDPSSGICTPAEQVVGCKDFYKKKSKEVEA